MAGYLVGLVYSALVWMNGLENVPTSLCKLTILYRFDKPIVQTT